MNYSRKLLFAVFLTCYSSIASYGLQEKTCGDPCALPSAWREFNSFTVKVTQPSQSGYSLWRGRFDKDSNDIQIDVEISDAGTTKAGRLLMVGGRVLAVQGPITEAGYEIDAVDAPVLELQLVVKLLGRIFPNGPASIQNSQALDYTDAKTGIQIATPSAGGMIEAPWHVVGKVARDANAIQYEMTLTSTTGTQGSGSTRQNVTNMSGMLSNVENTRIDDQLNLQTWQIFGVGVQSRKQEGSTTIDYSAAPEKTTYQTVADIRKNLAEKD